MENTNTDYTTKKTLMDYVKANIDVHINYLLFLNSFKGISPSKGFMTIAPIIEGLREKLYEAFADDLIPDDTSQVNMMITNKLGELLDEANLGEVKEFIGINLSEEDIINLSTSIFLRNSLANIPSIEVGNETETKIISSTLKNMGSNIPASEIAINGYSFELASYFLESLRIKAEKNQSIITYIYSFICDADIINTMARRLGANYRFSSAFDYLKNAIFQSTYITSNYNLANLIDELTFNTNYLTKKENKNLTLEKHM